MAFKMTILIPSIIAVALFAYLMLGLLLHFFKLYRSAFKTLQTGERETYGAALSSSQAEMDAIPAT